MDRAVRWYDYLTTNIYFFGLTTLVQTNGIIFPILVQTFVGEAEKASYLGTLRLWSLMAALLAQSAAGLISDHSTLRWGRRRPVILAGTLLSAATILAIVFTTDLTGMRGYWVLFALAVLLYATSNIAQGAQQALMPDVAPKEKLGLFSGIKAILELPLPMVLIYFTVAKAVSQGNIWAGYLIALGVLVAAMLGALLTREKPILKAPPLDLEPFLRLVAMTALFTIAILGAGKLVSITGLLLRPLNFMPLVIVLMGLAGLLAMAIAVGLGVWLSVQISFGPGGVRRNPSFTWWVVNRLAFLAGIVNLGTFAVYFIQARLGYVGEQAAGPASGLLLVTGVFILLSAIPSGALADRFGRKNVVALSGLLAALGTLIALLLPNLTVISVGLALIGTATGMFFAANWALGASLAPQGETGRYLGISNLAGAGAGAVGAYIGGPIADYFTTQFPQATGAGYMLLFAIFGVLFLVSAAVLGRVGDPQLPASQPAETIVSGVLPAETPARDEFGSG